MQERVLGSQNPYIQSSTSSSSTIITNLRSDDVTKVAEKEMSRKAAPFHLSVSSSHQSDQPSTSSYDHDPSVYCSSEAPVGGRICALESDGASPSDQVPWPTQFVHPEGIYDSVAEYEQACLKNTLVALGRLDGAMKSECLFPEALLTLLPRILSLANNGRLFFDHKPEASKEEKVSDLVESHENIFDGVPIVFTHNCLNPSSLIVDPSTGDLMGLINLQYAGFFPAYTEPIRQIFIDTPESAMPTRAFLSIDPSEQEKCSDAEDNVLRKRKSFKGLVGSIIRRSSGSHRRQPSTDDTTRTLSKGKGKAIVKRTQIIVPFSRIGGHPFPFAAINHFTTNDPLSSAPKFMIFTKKTRRTRREKTHATLEKAISLSGPNRGSFHPVSWIKRRSANGTIETKPALGSDSFSSSPVDLQAEEPSDLESNDTRQESPKVSSHAIVPKALHLCSNSWRHFLGSLREYEVKWVDRQTRLRLSTRILQDHCDSYRHYMHDVTSAGEDRCRASVRSSSSAYMIPLSNYGAAPLPAIKSQQNASNRPPSTVSTHSAVIVSNPDTRSARGFRSSFVPDTDVASSWTTKDSDRIEYGYGPVLEAFVSMTKTLQNLVVALEVRARVLTPEQFLRMIEAKARKEHLTTLQSQDLTSHRSMEDGAQQFSLTEEQRRQQQLYRMTAAATAGSSSFEPAMPQPKPKRSRVKRLLKTMFKSKQLHEPVVASYQPPIRTSEDNILYMGPPERDPLPSELPSHLVFVAPPPKTKPFSTISFSSSSLRLDAFQNKNMSTTYLSVDASMDDGDTCSYNSDDTDEIRHQIAAPPVVISGGTLYGLPPSMGAIASDIPVYGLRLSARDGAKTLYESERERLEDEERGFWAEFEGSDDRETFQKGSRKHGRVVILDMEDLETNVKIIEEFLAERDSKKDQFATSTECHLKLRGK
ncbi:hypothetical protein BGZ82_000717 [Podila clonocystis]|nr:hypothetical protein BGZ82_000717 [Podila clonocystis]